MPDHESQEHTHPAHEERSLTERPSAHSPDNPAGDLTSPNQTRAETTSAGQSGSGRPMQVRRFLCGTLVAATGVAIMLVVAFGLLQGWGVNERLSLPLIALCMIVGLMLLGGGFGVMATSAGTFDDDEFERLMAGERRRFDEQGNATLSPPRLTSEPPDEAPARNASDTVASLSC